MAFMGIVRDEREEAEIMKYVGVHDVNMGKGRVRKSFATIDEVVEMPDLIEVQKNSYDRFLKEDLREVLNDVSPIYDFNGNLKLEFVDYSLDKTPKYSLEECRERDMTYATALKVLVRLTNNETGEVKESEVFMGDFPLMTEHGTFIINGGERVIVSQLVRSPVYITARALIRPASTCLTRRLFRAAARGWSMKSTPTTLSGCVLTAPASCR